MLKDELSPDTVYVAGDFLTDGLDFLRRFHLCFERDFAIKSRRFKCFIDLRMGLECMLKSAIAYFGDDSLDRKSAIRYVESFGHNISKMISAVENELSPETRNAISPFAEEMHKLPVGLRYALDGYDFRTANESYYYQTIGCDTWMDSFYDALQLLQRELNTHLSSHSGFLSVSALREAVLNPRFNKYEK